MVRLLSLLHHTVRWKDQSALQPPARKTFANVETRNIAHCIDVYRETSTCLSWYKSLETFDNTS